MPFVILKALSVCFNDPNFAPRLCLVCFFSIVYDTLLQSVQRLFSPLLEDLLS